MALAYKDRVEETSTTTGTGTYTLAGAVAGSQSFAIIGNTNTTYYCAVDVDTNGVPQGGWEVGLGTYTLSGTTLARTSILASSNSNAAVSWSAGTRRVFTVLPASVITQIALLTANNVFVGNNTFPNLTLGNTATFSSRTTVSITDTLTNPAVNYIALGIDQEYDPSGNASGVYAEGLSFFGEVVSGNTQHIGQLYASYAEYSHWGSGLVDALYGAKFFADNNDTGTITKLYGVAIEPANYGSGVITTAYGSSVGFLGTGPITTAFSYYATALGGIATNAFPFWLDDQGVFAIHTINTFNSVYQARPALYNPQFTKFTPGATNQERVALQWESNVAVLRTEAGGTGTLRSINVAGATVQLNGQTITLGGALTTSGAFGSTFTMTGTTNVTFPTSGTLSTTTGTVTSVAASVPAFLSVAGSPITSSGTLAISLSGTALPVANGGTGITAFGTGVATALGVNVGSAGAFVTFNGALGTPSSGTLSNCTTLPISTGVSGLGSNVATFLGTPSSANLAAAVTDETGSGALVFATSPTFVTPILGTPTSGTLTNCTLPVGGVTGLGTGVGTWLATPSLTNLNSAVTGDSVTGLAATQTLTNKRITKRVVTASDATSVTPNSDNADVTYQLNTQATGTLTINADGGSPTNGQSWVFKIKSTNVQTFSWNSIFTGGTTALPTASTGSSKIDYYSFIYDSVTPKWDFTGQAVNF